MVSDRTPGPLRAGPLLTRPRCWPTHGAACAAATANGEPPAAPLLHPAAPPWGPPPTREELDNEAWIPTIAQLVILYTRVENLRRGDGHIADMHGHATIPLADIACDLGVPHGSPCPNHQPRWDSERPGGRHTCRVIEGVAHFDVDLDADGGRALIPTAVAARSSFRWSAPHGANKTGSRLWGGHGPDITPPRDNGATSSGANADHC